MILNKSSTLSILFLISSINGVAQKHWKEIVSVQDLYDSYPEKINFIFENLNLNYNGLEEVKINYNKGEWVLASELLLEYYKKKNRLRNFKKSSEQSNRSIAIADTILKNIFEVQNVKGKVPILEDGHRDWYYKGPNNDDEWAWLSNRHSQLYTVFNAYIETGNVSYALYIDEFLRDFIIKSWPYPKRKSSTSVWRGLEVSFRAKKWSEIFYSSFSIKYFNPATQLLILSSLIDHADYNRKYHSKKGNWLTMEISALAAVAAYFPEYKLSKQWLDYAVEEMNKSMKEQVYPDGVQNELSSHYHNVSLRNFEIFYDLCKQTGKELPKEYEQTLLKMYDYSAKIMRPDGGRILNNDSDKGNEEDNNRALISKAFEKFDQPEWQYISSNGVEGKRPDTLSVIYPWAGQLISRNGFDKNAHWSFFDIGPWGTGHQHQDKLHLSISIGVSDFLVDSGRFAYRGKVADKFRSYARSTAAHNTVLIDDKNQNPGPQKTNQPIQKKQYKINLDYDYAFGSFSSYEDLKGFAKHNRTFLYVKNEFWMVADRIDTDRPRNLKFLWHWHPDCSVEIKSNTVIGKNNNQSLKIIPLSNHVFQISEIKGQERPNVQGWYSPEYNLYQPNPLTQFSAEINENQSFLWVIVPGVEDSNQIKGTVIEQSLEHFKIELSIKDKKWLINLPLLNSSEVDIKKISELN